MNSLTQWILSHLSRGPGGGGRQGPAESERVLFTVFCFLLPDASLVGGDLQRLGAWFESTGP